MEVIGGIFFLFVFIIVIIAFVCAIMKYVFDGIGLMKMAKAKKEKYPWLSWIPWAKEYLRGKIAYNTDHGAAIFLCVTIGVTAITSIISFVVGFLSSFSRELIIVDTIAYTFIYLIGIGYSVYYYIIQYKIFKQFSKNTTIMIVFTILTGGFLAPIFNFAIRKNKIENIDNIR